MFFLVVVSDSMTPIKEENILFLNDTDPLLNCRKGVTVSSLENRNEIRVSIWTFVRKGNEGYITPRKGGISLTASEFELLTGNLPWITSRVRIKSQENIHRYIDAIDTIEDLNLLKRKLEAVEKNIAGTNPARPPKQLKRRAPPAAQGAP